MQFYLSLATGRHSKEVGISIQMLSSIAHNFMTGCIVVHQGALVRFRLDVGRAMSPLWLATSRSSCKVFKCKVFAVAADIRDIWR